MKTTLHIKDHTQTKVDHELARSIFTVVSASAVVLGLWGAACLVGALISHGAWAVARSYLTALTGY